MTPTRPFMNPKPRQPKVVTTFSHRMRIDLWQVSELALWFLDVEDSEGREIKHPTIAPSYGSAEQCLNAAKDLVRTLKREGKL